MGHFRGVDHSTHKLRMDRVAEAMRQRNLNNGRGCKARARAIMERLAKQGGKR